MTRDEILAKINSIGTCEDEGDRRVQLDSFRDDINTLFDISPKTTTFEKLYKHYNAVYGIEEDNWDEKVSKN